MTNLIDLLLFHTWWNYSQDNDLPMSEPFHWFNIAEGCVWFVFAALVIVRSVRHHFSAIEAVYAFAFLTFGLSDLREAWVQQSWLIWFKLANLIALFYLRKKVMTQKYPESKLF